MRKHLAYSCVAIAVAMASFLFSAVCQGRVASTQAAPLDVAINEVAWSGTVANSADEWIELLNNTAAPLDLAGWTLATGDSTPSINLVGTIPAHGFFLLERTDDLTVADVPADQIYTGNLSNTGERLELRDATGALVDSADGNGGWPAGSSSPTYHSMERIDAGAPDLTSNWASNDGLVRNGQDVEGNPINGTPKARNSVTPLPGADLVVDKHGPEAILSGALITYTIHLSNAGPLAAEGTRLTDVLPADVAFIAHSAPYAASQPASGTLVWELGSLPAAPGALITFTLTGQVAEGVTGDLINVVTATSTTTERTPADNADQVITPVSSPPVAPVVLIEALHYDGYEYLHADEAFRVMNISTVTAALEGWSVSDQEAAAVFPPGALLLPGGALWCARDAAAFARQFGFLPDYEYGADANPAVPDMAGGTPRFGSGDECVLQDPTGRTADVLVYGSGDTSSSGWYGPAIQPWAPTPTFAAEGQILYRKRDQVSGLPVPDTDTAADWAQDPGDQLDGRKVLYPGWDLDAFFFTQRVTETATLTVSVAPDNLFETLAPLLAGAQHQIQVESYTFRSKELADILLERLGQGVAVSLLLEGAPAVEGVTDQEQALVQQLSEAGAEVLFMINDAGADVYDRYRNQHAKLIVVDGELVVIGTENLSFTGMPADSKANGTAGRRGVCLITDAPGVVARVAAAFEVDADPDHHVDLAGCDRVPELCSPPPTFEPTMTPDWVTYTVKFSKPLVTTGQMAFEVIQSPENSLRDRDGLLGLLKRAGPGDTILVQMFYEHKHWGPSDGTPATDHNPRLEAYLAAARRGARVRILLDGHFDQDGVNPATLAYSVQIANKEGLDLEARLGDPTFLGLHNKMVLAHIGGRGYVHAGSINGSEASSKINRELALQVQSDDAYEYLRALFDYDWSVSTPPLYLPLVVASYRSPLRADHLLISEVYYGGSKEQEWVEIANPTLETVDLTFYRIGDAQYWGVFEGMYRFPSSVALAPQQTLVVVSSAVAFRTEHPSLVPDFEFYATDPEVPDLIKTTLWGTGEWHLSNTGDEVLLLDDDNMPLDVVVYGNGMYPGVEAHPGVSLYTHSLERFPYAYDTDNCGVDFRDWAFPNPGALP
jgi:uncharacterized repeat protein (TIGR01451 family)